MEQLARGQRRCFLATSGSGVVFRKFLAEFSLSLRGATFATKQSRGVRDHVARNEIASVPSQ
jgi:hypothetical protein